MKYIKNVTIIALIITCISACSKNKTCYECEHVSGGQVVKEKVCTEGDPESKLPTHDSNGAIHWSCKEK